MELLENQNTVKIIGDCFGHQVTMEISRLQLAKIFGTNKEVLKKVENDFGSKEYEDRCEETREYVKKFPEIKVWNNELGFGYVSVEDQK
jgi:plasmid maintenance system antidote protein VapI